MCAKPRNGCRVVRILSPAGVSALEQNQTRSCLDNVEPTAQLGTPSRAEAPPKIRSMQAYIF